MTRSHLHGQEMAEQFARNLIRCRKRAGLSQPEVALRAELGRGHVSVMERAKRLPQLTTAIKLAGAIGVEPAELMRGIEWRVLNGTAVLYVRGERVDD